MFNDDGDDSNGRDPCFTGEHYFFDSSGKFLGLTTSTDVIDETCQGRGYWPERVTCTGATVTRVHCGTVWKVGDPL